MTDAFLRRVRPDQLRELVLVVIIALLVVFFSTQIEGYLSPRTFLRVTTGFPIVATVAVGQVLVVLTRNIDLSVGSVVGLTAYTVGTLLGQQPDMNPVLVFAIAMGMGAVMGAINGLIVAYGRVPAIITTLGTMAIYREILVEISGSRTVTTTGFPDWMTSFPSTDLFKLGDLDFRLALVVTLVAVVIGQLVLRYLPFGRRLYAIGSNPDAARVAGLPRQRDIFTAFTFSGMMAGLGGLLFLAKFGNITVVAGSGLELQVVAAVVVGGVAINGGSGSMIGALLGAILIETLEQSLLRWLGMSDFVRDAILGILIVIAVAADGVVRGRLNERWARVRRMDHERERAAREGTAHAT
ncbi:MAG: ABC transporter permease [Chloroflexota bacterium]